MALGISVYFLVLTTHLHLSYDERAPGPATWSPVNTPYAVVSGVWTYWTLERHLRETLWRAKIIKAPPPFHPPPPHSLRSAWDPLGRGGAKAGRGLYVAR